MSSAKNQLIERIAEAVASKIVLMLTGSTRDLDRIADLPLPERQKYWKEQRLRKKGTTSGRL